MHHGIHHPHRSRGTQPHFILFAGTDRETLAAPIHASGGNAKAFTVRIGSGGNKPETPGSGVTVQPSGRRNAATRHRSWPKQPGHHHEIACRRPHRQRPTGRIGGRGQRQQESYLVRLVGRTPLEVISTIKNRLSLASYGCP